MFASAILGSRALAPVEQAIGNWRGLVAARQSWHRLEGHLATLRQDLPRLALPRPHKELRVENLAMGPPGRPQLTLAGISFRLMAGEALGIVGASGSRSDEHTSELQSLMRISYAVFSLNKKKDDRQNNQ